MYVAERAASSARTIGIRLDPGEYRLEARDDDDPFDGLPMSITVANGQASYVKIGLTLNSNGP